MTTNAEPSPLLEATDLSVEIPALPGERALGLRRVSLSLRPGELLVLAGEAGSGPSLFARLVGGFADPRTKALSGSLAFEEEPLLGATRRSHLRRRRGPLALILGDGAAPPEPGRSVAQWLADCLRRRSGPKRDWADACFSAGLLEPESLLRRPLTELPPLVRRRLDVVRALLRGARLLVSDGAATDLDPLSAELYHELLARVRDEHGLGVLVASDTLRGVARFADRVVVFFEGSVLESGPAAVIAASPAFAYTREFRECSVAPGLRPVDRPAIGREALHEAEAAVHQPVASPFVPAG